MWRLGLVLQCALPLSPFTGLNPALLSDLAAATALANEIRSLLAKQVIVTVPSEDVVRGVHSQCFLF